MSEAEAAAATPPVAAEGAAPPAAGGKPKPKKEKKEKPPKKDKPAQKPGGKKGDKGMLDTKGVNAKKDEDLANWYHEVLTRSGMIDHYDVGGCYIIRPWAMKVWKEIQAWFGGEIEKFDVEDCYFPIFIPADVLEKEKDHVEGFAPEVAWVTKSGSSDLAAPIAIRPTSETVMYPAFARWCRSHRDFPLKLNQWCNVVRWEFSNPQPFIRTREFLWQEGHTAHTVKKDAMDEVAHVLDLYRQVYEDLLAVPVVPGRKTEKERFAGGDYTCTVESYVPASGRGCQSATSHHLGQNFAKMFGLKFEDPEAEGGHNYAYQNSWGLSTRSIGVMVLVHGDDKGLVMPPRVAPLQVVLVPCGVTKSTAADVAERINQKATECVNNLKAAGVRAKLDNRTNYSPGWRFADWEVKGVPLRIEFGPKDLEGDCYVAVTRHNGQKEMNLPLGSFVADIQAKLVQIQADMFAKAKAARDEKMVQKTKWEEFTPALNDKCIVLAPHCDVEDCEDDIKKISAEESKVQVEEGAPSMGAKTLCIPDTQPPLAADAVCIKCGKAAKHWTLFGRSY